LSKRKNFQIVVVISLEDWEATMVECKLQVLFENEKENSKLLCVIGGSIFCTFSFSIAIFPI
jgi:hypothetical protein